MSDRFYCPEPPSEGRLALGPAEAHHLARVRRVEPGAVVEVFDGRGQGYRARVRSLGKQRVELEILEALPDRVTPLELTLATAVPKGERFDWLVEKATELGVVRLVPLITARSTVDPRPSKLDRLRRTIVEAAKQCGRNRLMNLDEPVAWTTWLDRVEDQASVPVCLLAHPGGEPIGRVSFQPRASLVLAIGPEGGFTEDETQDAQGRGWRTVGLGPTLLRIETAALAGAASLLARADLGDGMILR